MKIDKKHLVWLGILLQWVVSFITDKRIFNNFYSERLEYIFVKILLLFVLVLIWKFGCTIVITAGVERKVFIYSLPYFFFLSVLFVINKYPQMGLIGDEATIYNMVLSTGAFPGLFTYFTSLFYTISLMIIPSEIGIVLIKMVLQSLLCGYCVWRFRKYYNNWVAYMAYALFFMPPVLFNGWLIHRMQIYMLAYLLFVTILLFDYLEKQDLNIKKQLTLYIISAVLVFWRREGIYLIIIAPIIIGITYGISTKKNWIKHIAYFLLILMLVVTPEVLAWCEKGSAISEASHTYNSYVVHLCRAGLKKDMYPKQMEAIEKVISIEAIDYINEQLGDENYKDEYIAWKEGYIGVRQDYTEEEYQDYVAAVWHIIFHEPLLFIKTRLEAWNYAAAHSKVIFLPEESSFPFRFVADIWNLTYNLYLPMAVIVIAFFYAMRKKIWLLFWLIGGLLAHTFLTALLMPASYFKYFYHMYAVGYLLLIIFICEKLSKHFEGKAEPEHEKG